MAVLSARMGLRHFPSVHGAFRSQSFCGARDKMRQLSPLGGSQAGSGDVVNMGFVSQVCWCSGGYGRRMAGTPTVDTNLGTLSGPCV